MTSNPATLPGAGRKRVAGFAGGAFAVIYFALDAAFWGLIWPIRQMIDPLPPFPPIARWIARLNPWACLALFIVPVAVLEPVKPVGLYWMATGHFKRGLALIIAGEVIKLSLVERLFGLTRERLLELRGFAWVYFRYRKFRDAVERTRAWRAARRFIHRERREVMRNLRSLFV